ncbi:MAG: hypothetical protein ACREE6_02840 [Limisphaerales bacterium]
MKSSAQDLPYWDAQNPGAPPGSFAGTVVATNGILYAIVTTEIEGEPPELVEWTQSSGWQAVAMFEGGGPGIGTFGLDLAGDSLYVGGDFSAILNPNGTTNIVADNVVSYNLTTQAWTDLGRCALTNSVEAVTVDAKGNVYVCCAIGILSYYGACDTPYPLTNILLELSGKSWLPVGGGLAGEGGSPGSGKCPDNPNIFESPDPPENYLLATDGTNVFISSHLLYGVNSDGTWVYSPSLIMWNGTRFQAMGPPTGSPGLYSPSWANLVFWTESLAVSGTNVFVTGTFAGTTAGCDDTCAGTFPEGVTIARFSTSGQYIPTAALLLESTNTDCGPDFTPAPGFTWPAAFAMAAPGSNGTLYVTGNFDTLQTNYQGLFSSGYEVFTAPAPADSLSANGVAEWDGSSWVALGTGLQYGACAGTGFEIAADNGTVYAAAVSTIAEPAPSGGFEPGNPAPQGAPDFTAAGGVTCTNGLFVRWITAPLINLLYSPSEHLLSWSWDGAPPRQWKLQREDTCHGGWYTYATYESNITSISTTGMMGSFQIQGIGANGSAVTPWSNVQAFNDWVAATLTLTYSASVNTLSWSWNGPTPYGWFVQKLINEDPEQWENADYIPGSQTSIDVRGWDGIFNVYGVDQDLCPITPFSNNQAFNDP